MAPGGNKQQHLVNEYEDGESADGPDVSSSDAGSSQKRGRGKAVNRSLHELVRKKGKVIVEIPSDKWRPISSECAELTCEAGLICRYYVSLIDDNGDVISDWRHVPRPNKELLHDKLKDISSAAKKNRQELKIRHTGGSKPFVCYLEEMRKRNENEDNQFSMIDFYKETHFSRRKGDWLSNEAHDLHSKMIKARDDPSSSDEWAQGLTEDQIAFQIIGERKNYVRGLGKGEVALVSSSRQELSSQLENATQRAEMAERSASEARAMIEEYKERLEQQQSQIQEQQTQIDTLMEFMREQRCKRR